jgi:hypothetical protein
MPTLRAVLVAAGRAARGGGSILAVLVAVGVIGALLAGRDGAAAPAAPSATPPIVAAVGASPTSGDPTPSAAAIPSLVAETQSPELTSAPTPLPEPTTDPTPAATPRATLKPTPKPTPQPIHDPAPEPTPTVFTKSGSFGSTLAAGGVEVFLDRHAPSSDPTCVSSDPALQGHTQVVSFELRITWSKPAEAMEPFIGVGAKPWFSVQWYDPSGFRSGGTYVWSTCVRPGDTDPAVVSFESNGGPPRSYRFTYR